MTALLAAAASGMPVLDTTQVVTEGLHVERSVVPRTPLPEEFRKILLGPSSVEVALSKRDEHDGEFRQGSRWRKLSKADAKQVGELVVSQELYQPDVKACIFQATLAYRFKRADETLLLVICHSCAQTQMKLPRAITGVDIDRVNGDLIAIARKTFPEEQLLADLAAKVARYDSLRTRLDRERH